MPPASLLREFVGLGVLLPAVIVAAGLLLARRLRRSHERVAAAIATLALAIAFGAAVFALQLSRLQPLAVRGWEWLPHIVLGASLIVGVTALVPVALIRVAGVILAAALAADRLIPYWPALGPSRSNWDFGLAIASFALFLQLRRTADRFSSFTLALVLTAATVAASVVLMLAGIATFAQSAAILTTSAAVCVVASWRDRNAKYLAVALPILALPLTGLLVSGYLNSYSDVPRWSYVLVWLAPFSLGAGALADERPSRGQVALSFAGLIAILGIAVALAVRAAPPFET